MIQILSSLEVRYFKSKEIIARELEEAQEFYFVENGQYDIGYEINKVSHYRL
jgi:hypothetical protein